MGRLDRRTVSPQVSLYASLLQYDIRDSDGSFVGRNPDQTVAPSAVDLDHGAHVEGAGPVVHRIGHGHGHETNWREYTWYADDALAPETVDTAPAEPGRVCVLKDMGDVRNHRHHGLIGALVVEPGDVTPWAPGTWTPDSTNEQATGWSGVEVELRHANGDLVAGEGVIFYQDGLRQFVGGDPTMPVSDVPLEDENELDSGLKAISYRTALIHRGRPPVGADPEPPLLTVQPAHRSGCVSSGRATSCDSTLHAAWAGLGGGPQGSGRGVDGRVERGWSAAGPRTSWCIQWNPATTSSVPAATGSAPRWESGT